MIREKCINQLSQAMNANFHIHVRQYKPKVSDLLLMSMALSSNPSCPSTVIYPFFSLQNEGEASKRISHSSHDHHQSNKGMVFLATSCRNVNKWSINEWWRMICRAIRERETTRKRNESPVFPAISHGWAFINNGVSRIYYLFVA